MDPVSLLCDTKPVGGSSAVGTAAVEPNEQILRLMAGLGIDAQKTRDSLKVCVPNVWTFQFVILRAELTNRTVANFFTCFRPPAPSLPLLLVHTVK